eukprot:m.26384 g.26384  ORF g.26384 m.26384 type:complete len:520 (+) comp8199_c0_seq1:245-1804(+)
MASAGAEDLDSQVATFMSVTKASQPVAVAMLEAADFNLETAINLHMEGGQAPSAGSRGAAASAAPSQRSRAASKDGVTEQPARRPSRKRPLASASAADSQPGEEGVRAPIAPKHMTLVDGGPAGVPLRALRSRGASLGFGPLLSRSVQEPFRSFAPQHDRDQDHDEIDDDLYMDAARARKRKRDLAELFAPPADISFSGTFEEARDLAKSSHKHLLINIQDVEEFACQTLNRDVWKHPLVRDLLSQKFVFWQRVKHTPDAAFYERYYPVSGYPHIAFVDPMTAQRQLVLSSSQTVESFMDHAMHFLDKAGSSGEEDGGTAAAASAALPEAAAAASGAQPASRPATSASEEEELRRAIAASLETAGGTGASSPTTLLDRVASGGHGAVPEAPDKTSPAAKARHDSGQPAAIDLTGEGSGGSGGDEPAAPADIQLPDEPPASCTEPTAKFRFIFPDSARVQRRFLASEPLQVLFDFAALQGYSSDKYALLFGHNRQSLDELDPTSLASNQLKSETIHVCAK